jgi:sugar phosphate isomerase/epimerase
VADNRFKNIPNNAPNGIVRGTTLADWKWIADHLNRIGAMSKKAGILVGYHNHNLEFRRINGEMVFEKLIEWTDPKLVTIELDLGWVAAAGLDAAAFSQKHAKRISLLHVKDVKRGTKPSVDVMEANTTEVGNGEIDWKRVFGALDKTQIKHYFVEQENFDRPILEAAKISHDYLAKLKV